MSDSTRFFSFFALYLSHFTCLTINLNLQYSLLRLLLQFTNITIYLASNRVIIFKLLRAIIRASSFVKSNYTKLSLRFVSEIDRKSRPNSFQSESTKQKL